MIRRLRSLFLAATIGAACLGSGALNAQNLLADGGFELGQTSGPGTVVNSVFYGAWANFTLTCVEAGVPSGFVPAYEGSEAMRMGNQGDLVQSFTTTAGKKYRISLAVNSPGGQVGTVQAVLRDNLDHTNLVASFVSPGSYQWRSNSFSFLATGASTELKLLNVSAAGQLAFIDDVRVVEESNYLDDGGFELGLTSGPNTYASRATYGAWSAIGSPTTFLFGMPNGTVPAYEGREAMLIGNGGTAGFVTQSIATTVGQTYWLSFAVNAADGLGGTVQATVNSLPSLVQNVAAPGANGWGVASYPFVAGSATTTVKIQNVGGPSIIDDVRVASTPLDMALKFDGVNDHVSIPGFGNQMPTTEVTVEFWQKVGSAKAQSTFSCNANAFNAHVPWVDGQVYWDFGGKRLQYTPPVPIVGTWQHFALVSSVANGYMLIYRNGVAEAVLPSSAGTFTRGNFDLLIGRNGAGYFGGEIDEFRIWNVARTQGQITANINTRLTGNEAGLVAYYRMDEGSGTGLVDATTPADNGSLVNGTKRVKSTVPVCGLATQELNVVSPSTYSYSYGGYPAAGINLSLVGLPPSVTNILLSVTNLCFDITPAAGTAGVNLSRVVGQNLSLNYDGGIWITRTTGDGAVGLKVSSSGQAGIRGADGVFLSNNGGDGSGGQSAGVVTIESKGAVVTAGAGSPVILGVSQGGRGGDGGNGFNDPIAGANDGGAGAGGGNAGVVSITGTGSLNTSGTNATGVLALSQAGQGGDGGEGHAAGEGGNGGFGGDASAVMVAGSWTIHTSGEAAHGISARSQGGAGGASGGGGWIDGAGGNGGGSGDGGSASVELEPGGFIETSGNEAHGIFAQSIGGFAGGGTSADSLFSADGGNGGSAGSGGDVSVANSGTVRTHGFGANAIFAESVGGGGGSGGTGDGLFSGASNNGVSSAGGNGGQVTVYNYGSAQTGNDFARGIFAQSVGGSGGNGSLASGKFYSVGGSAGIGGNGDNVNIINEGQVTTGGNDSSGVFAQSVGGGGGTGGGAVSSGSFAVSVGGRGGGGGDGATVYVDSSAQASIDTFGDRSHGIFAQSVGGGGGNGGFAISMATGGTISLAVGAGGNGGAGGSGDNVWVTSASTITTGGQDAHGIVAQSVGGGGGSGGFSVTLSGGAAAGAISVGGGAGGGGDGRQVTLINNGSVLTETNRSYGLFAQSVGGGGGDGGFSISGAIGAGGLAAGLGGSGGLGGDGGDVNASNRGSLATHGEDSHAIVAQSIGGGGGSGGFNISAAGGLSGALSAGMGGKGGAGGSAGTVSADNQDLVETFGRHSYGILAQSVGGGGGDGGFNISASGGYSGPPIALGFGGSGGIGGLGNNVDVANNGEIYTDGEMSHGIMAQSIGGGGGSGGFSVAAAIGFQNPALAFSMGGEGGSGNAAGEVSVLNTGLISTIGDEAAGVFAQSVGGGGGNGGASFTGTFTGAAGKSASVSLGGNGGTGGDGNFVNVVNDGYVETEGARARGIFAQSVGGGGGNGGMSGALNLGLASAGNSVQVAVTVGGRGGAGGVGGDVLIGGTGDVFTAGNESEGIFAQSIGGGGGNGGSSLAANVLLGAGNVDNSTNLAVSVAVGGGAGIGNRGGTVTIDRSGSIDTLGDGSHGIFAQSVGGGGGTGGSARAINLFLQKNDYEATNSPLTSRQLSFGGSGGSGGVGGAVGVTNVGNISTYGGDAHGIFAQSVGGGGGTGGDGHKGLNNLTDSVVINGIISQLVDAVQAEAKSTELNFGGIGGTGNDGGDVTVDQTGDITTQSDGSYGVLAQSLGAGGGVGGNGMVDVDATGLLEGNFRLSGRVDLASGVHASGQGGAVDVSTAGTIDTSGAGSFGIFAQSVGGGGGTAGNLVRGLRNIGSSIGLNTSLQGGGGGGEGDGGSVMVESTGDVVTRGMGATGIFAQSVGGGGGVAGNLGAYDSGAEPLNFAGSAGGVGSGGHVVVSQVGNITTSGMSAHGIFAQSAGGIGSGGGVEVTLDGTILAPGDGADGIFVQSRGNTFNGSGDIDVSILNGGVQGGSGAGVGVRFVGGVNNSLINQGSISSASGLAVLGFFGHETIDNYGTIQGSVYLGGGNNSFLNRVGATMNLGTSGVMDLGVGNTFSNQGTLGGSGQIIGNVVSSGAIASGSPAGNLAIDGSLTLQSTAGVSFDLGGRQQGVTYDSIQATSFVQFAGTLSLSLANNFVPGSSDTFTLMEFASKLGSFDNALNGARLATADNLASFQVNYTSTTLQVGGFESPDTDGDGMTDYEESLAGTDRLSPQSVLACAAPTRNGSGQIVVRFARVTGRNYTIVFAHDLGNPTWTEVPSPVITYPDAGTAEWIDDGAQTGGLNGPPTFYRVKLKL